MPRASERMRAKAIALELEDNSRLIAGLPLAIILSAALWSLILAAVLR